MRTDITFLVDRSGSMATIAQDMRGGFREFVRKQREIPGACRVSVYTFDDTLEKHSEQDLHTMSDELPLSPRGWTALYDSLGKVITETGERLAGMIPALRPEKVIIVVITDGADNRSREFSTSTLKSMIEHQRSKYSWEFVFLGANLDAHLTAGYLGILDAHTVTYDATRRGTRALYSVLNNSIGATRTGRSIGNLQASYDDQSKNILP